MSLDNPNFVSRQYASTDRLATRASVWHDDPASPSPHEVALASLAELPTRRLLEVGCGRGAFARRCADTLGCEVIATDLSEAMVASARALDLDARVASVEALPFSAGAFDAVVAAWMLYHVGDLPKAMAEIARVLRPGGRLVAITNGEGHLAELWSAVGRSAPAPSFSRGSGRGILEPWFPRVERRDLTSTARFPDRQSIAAYLASVDVAIDPARLAQLREPFEAHGEPTVFIADR